MSGVQKQCPICKIPVEPGLDGSCTGCGVALDDVLEIVDLDTAAMSLDASCASCGGLLMGATDACPLCGVALPLPAPLGEPAAAPPEEAIGEPAAAPPEAEVAAPGDCPSESARHDDPRHDAGVPRGAATYVPETFVPAVEEVAEPGDTFVPPLENVITPTDVTADTVVSAARIPAEPPSPSDVETLGAPPPATAEDQELWSGLPVSWEKQPGANGAQAPEPAPVEPASISLEALAPPAVPPATAPEAASPDPIDGEAPLYVGAVAPAAPVPEPAPIRPVVAPAPPAGAPASPPWQSPKKDAPLELETRTPRKTSWEQRWQRAEGEAPSRPARRVERRWVAAALLFAGLLAAGAVGAAQLGLLGPGSDETGVVAGDTPEPGGSGTALALAPTPATTPATPKTATSATPKPSATVVAVATVTKGTATPIPPTPTATAVVATPNPAPSVTAKPAATALALAATPTLPKPTATPPPTTPTPSPSVPKPTPTPTPSPPKPTPTQVAIAIATPPPATPAATSAAATGSPHAAAVQRGQALIQQGKVDEAVREFKKLVKDDDDFADGHYHLGSAYAYQGEFNKACTELRRYLKMAPQGPYATSARASLANCP